MKNLGVDKSLGQHFLSNPGVIRKVVDKIQTFSSRDLIEVGPGAGALTEELLSRGFRVLAIEVDPRWCEKLKEKFSRPVAESRLRILCADATQVPLEELPREFSMTEVTLCGNLPYNCGQEILLRFFENADYAHAFVVMLQKEVVEKFLPRAERKSYGPLSIKMSFLARDLSAFPVSPGSFCPPPKVDSAVLAFSRQDCDWSPLWNKEAYEGFSRFLNAAFQRRRKKLSNNIVTESFGEEFRKLFALYASKRAEELSPEDFLKLYRTTRRS